MTRVVSPRSPINAISKFGIGVAGESGSTKRIRIVTLNARGDSSVGVVGQA